MTKCLYVTVVPETHFLAHLQNEHQNINIFGRRVVILTSQN